MRGKRVKTFSAVVAVTLIIIAFILPAWTIYICWFPEEMPFRPGPEGEYVVFGDVYLPPDIFDPFKDPAVGAEVKLIRNGVIEQITKVGHEPALGLSAFYFEGLREGSWSVRISMTGTILEGFYKDTIVSFDIVGDNLYIGEITLKEREWGTFFEFLLKIFATVISLAAAIGLIIAARAVRKIGRLSKSEARKV